RPGTSARDLDSDGPVAKLSSNELADPPIPEVVAAIAAAAGEVNRYPDNTRTALRAALAAELGVDAGRIWAGGASNELGTLLAIAFGGPGRTIAYPWPSFSLYPIATRTAGCEAIEVPLDAGHRVDLDGMRRALRDDTTVVFVCNPNNPSATHVPFDDLEAFVASVPEDVLVVVDEAYHEFATAPDHGSAVGLAAERPNVAVTRTFSKAHGLAGLRLGYVVADPGILDGIRRIQIPFTVTELAMAGAIESLRHPDVVADRVARVVAGRDLLTRELRVRGVPVTDSQTNFVYAELGDEADRIVAGLLAEGVIVRVVPPEGFVRISVGTDDETKRFLEAFDRVS
ncbi:MAG: histidinol-phosphate transaminase, partial [Acidimicrobiia bacterium]|nr:histidinol-phosphate transaminase [Acidimicrobiia bacterium]